MPTLAVEQTLSGADLGLTFGLTDLLVLDTGARRIVYVLSRTDGTLVEVEIAPDGTLSFVDSLALTGGFALGSDPALAHVSEAGGGQWLAIAGLPAAAGQSVTLAATGALGAQAGLSAAGQLVAPAHADLGDAQALVTGRAGAGGLDLFTDTGGGFTYTASLEDAADRYLGDVSASVTFRIGASTYVATASATEDGLNLAEVTTTSLAQRDTVGVAEGLPVNTPRELDVIARLDETLLVVGSFDTSSLSVVRVEADGAFEIADHVLDAPWTYFQGVAALDTVVHGDFAFVAAGGAEAGLSLFTVLPGGRLIHLDSLADDAATTLYRVSAIEMTITGNRLDILAASPWEAGLTRIGYELSSLGTVVMAPPGGSVTGTAGDDQLIGSDLADTLSGGAGEDILADGAGMDVLTGGPGRDLFAMHPDGVEDRITDFDRTEDRLDLSAFDFLYDVSQLQVTPTADGAIVSYRAETIVITTSNATPLTLAELTNEMILNVDRPPMVASAQELLGSIGPDVLNGAAGSDTILGLDGDDALTGQAGEDTLDGGLGSDTLSGDDGADLLVGGAGDDLVNGGFGDDLIYGDAYAWGGG